MKKRVLGAALAVCAMVPAAITAQQTVRFNDRAQLIEDEAPLVDVWIDGTRSFNYADPVRVRFRVEEDAYVIVARIDAEGQLTLLHPRSPRSQRIVRGGIDNSIFGSRLGARGTFLATDRTGGTGYVFAIASYTPFDLSALRQSDFSAWVTGISMGQPVGRFYVGDPHRSIGRFAQLVVPYDETVYDYDVQYYSVGGPTWFTSSVGYNEQCVGYPYTGSTYYSHYRGGYGYRYGGCGIPWGLQNCAFGMTHYSWSLGVPIGCFTPVRHREVAHNPPVLPPYSPGDTARLNPWVVDSIGRPNVDKGGAANGPHVMAIDNAADRVRTEESYAIPRRAWERMRGRSDESTRPSGGGVRAASEAAASVPMPMPARPAPVTADKPTNIEWVRRPQPEATPNREEPRVPRRGIRRDNVDRGGSRGMDAPSRGIRHSDPPPRVSTPSIERRSPAPSRSPGGSPGIRRGGDDNRIRRSDPPARQAPAVRSEPRSTSSPATSSGTTRQKPTEVKKPTEERKP